MKKFIIGNKIGMTQLLDDEGIATGVTVVQAEPNEILKVKTVENSGYNAVLVGYGERKAKRCNRPLLGTFKSLNTEPKKVLKEFRVDEMDGYKENETITVEQFKSGERVCVSGTTKGRGFTGTIKRHGFARGPMSHGSKSHRIPGSIGAGTSPGRVLKGKEMPGHYGDSKVSIKGLKIMKVDTEKNLVFIKGAIPGRNKGLIIIYS